MNAAIFTHLIYDYSFTKIRVLGKGDVGKVYLVKQKGTDKLVAMKGMVYHV